MLNEWMKQFIESGVEVILAGSVQNRNGKKDLGDSYLDLGQGQQTWTVRVEQPSRLEHGDYASNIAMQLAKLLKRSPMAIAEEIRKALEGREPLVAKLEVAAPGFLNIFVNWEEWACRPPVHPAAFGDGTRPQKMVVEHTSINPNKSAHIGHLRNSCIGDTLVRMLRKSGAKVEVHNYIDDLGNQLADTVVGLLQIPVEGEHKRFGDFCWDVYSGLHRQAGNRLELGNERARVLHALEEGTGNLSWLGYVTASQITREHLEEMQQFVPYICRTKYWSGPTES
jgi:arginyl-tRNA synthetase